MDLLQEEHFHEDPMQQQPEPQPGLQTEDNSEQEI
jgi:hypothetical protein